MHSKLKGVARLLSLFLGSAAWAGELHFTRALDTPYPKASGTSAGDLAVGDLDGDGLQDLLIVGQADKPATRIVRQAPGGKFVAPLETTAQHGLPIMTAGACARLADVDGDHDLDVVLYGKTGPSAETALFHVYANDGKGKFTLLADLGRDLPLEDFEDVPGSWGKAGTAPDNHTDQNVKGLYNFNGWSRGVLELADFTGDGLPDILFAGTKGAESGTDPSNQTIQRDWETSGVFVNQGHGAFAYLTAAGWPRAGLPVDPETQPSRSYPGLAKVQRGAAAVGDWNGDGKLDVVLFGQANTGPRANPGVPETQRNGQPLAEAYLGRGDGTFTLVAQPGLQPLIDGSVRAADLDGDGKVDLVALGSTGHPKDPDGGRFTRIYRGQGDGTFKVDETQRYARPTGQPETIAPMMSGDVAIGDLDGDGKLDLVMAGNAGQRELFVYLNTEGRFVLQGMKKMTHGLDATDARLSSGSDASAEGDVLIQDLDGDGKNDLVINGRGGSNQLLVLLRK